MAYPQIVGPNVSTAWLWPEVSILRARTDGDTIYLDHSMAGRWPPITPDDVTVEANAWIVAQIDGRWLSATWEWLRPGQTRKTLRAEDYQLIVKAAEFAGWVPGTGETVGYWVSTPARAGQRTIDERSNVSWIQYGTSIEVPCPIPDWPGTTLPPEPPPEPPPSDDLTARVRALEVEVAQLKATFRAAGAVMADV